MDKKSIIGYVLIGVVLLGYFYYSRPSEEQLQAERIFAEKQRKDSARKDSIIMAEEVKKMELVNNESNFFYNVLRGENKNVTIENEKIKVDISTYGGRVASVTVKDHMGQDGNPLVLFDSKDKINVTEANKALNGSNTINFFFKSNLADRNINTNELFFTPMNASDSSVTMRLDFKEGDRYIDFIYSLKGNSQILDLDIVAHNMNDIIGSDKVGITWKQFVRQLEPGYDFEQRFSSLTYKPIDDDSDYLSEMSDDEEKFSESMHWIAYKNQFFSAIMIAGDKFTDAEMKSEVIQKEKNLLKRCTSKMSTEFDPTGNEPTSLQFYFGPNKFDTLKESNAFVASNGSDPELEEIIYFGWPVVRWINRYLIMPLFDILSGFGLNMGIVLILLTLIVKVFVYPFTKKSYVSSAKMRALKPYVDEINAKYTKSEDALKKQQETMALYQKYGASPMGGCLPMLIQMPIFIALFNFVPNAIELRQQSFLWANDLSSYDAILSWDTSLPLIGNHLSLFCLLFCITQLLNTYYTSKMQPSMGGSPEMEQQQKIMRWMMYGMPIMFFFMFNEYSSGLNFYYFVSTLSSVIIYIYLRKAVNEDELLKKMEAYAASNKNNPAKQSNMMSRLEALQEQQKKLVEERERMRNERKNKK
ncbi:MAG: membrane protein insertase YidC [Bacteroidaceae bacterium]|nr:membrane protein insertase YidC [Bacteroidaceae bacterium]